MERLNDNYPGGLAAYIHNARKLLADSKSGKNPFEGYIPSVSKGFFCHQIWVPFGLLLALRLVL